MGCSSQQTRKKSRTQTATENSGKRICWEKCSNYEETAHKSRRREAQEEGEEGITQKKGKAQEEGEEGITQKKRKNTGGRRKEGSHGRRRKNEEGKRGVRRGDPLPTRGKQKSAQDYIAKKAKGNTRHARVLSRPHPTRKLKIFELKNNRLL